MIDQAEGPSSGETQLQVDWLPLDAVIPLCLPHDLHLQQQHAQSMDAAKRRRLERLFGRMEVPRRFQGLGPETLTKEAQNGKEWAILAANRWINDSTMKPGLLIWGYPGVGKSVLGWWAVPQRGWGLWVTWPEFYKGVQEGYALGDDRAKMRLAKGVPVLFLDDLGDPDRHKIATNDQRDILFELINHRCQHWLPIFITSNLNGEHLFRQFGDRIISRLVEFCEFVEMGGVDLRRSR